MITNEIYRLQNHRYVMKTINLLSSIKNVIMQVITDIRNSIIDKMCRRPLIAVKVTALGEPRLLVCVGKRHVSTFALNFSLFVS